MIVKVLAFLLRIFSFVFHLTLSAFLSGIALIAFTSHQPLGLGMLPFAPEHLIRNTALLGLAGIVCTLLAFSRRLRFIFVLWALLVVYLIINGYFFSPYVFHGPQELKCVAWFALGALCAFFGAAWSLKSERRSGVR